MIYKGYDIIKVAVNDERIDFIYQIVKDGKYIANSTTEDGAKQFINIFNYFKM